MFRTKKGKTFFKDNVKKLMRMEKNDRLKSLIENEETYPTLSDSTGRTLLHMAARYDNIEMMRYSIDSGCKIDAKDANGTTPLIVATKYNNISAMELLLHFNADILTTNLAGEYSLQLMFDHNRTKHSRITHVYWRKVKSNSRSVEEAADVLLKAGSSLEHAAIMRDAEMTRIFLDKIKEISFAICFNSMTYSMILIDYANLEVILSRGPHVAQMITFFFWMLHTMTNTKRHRVRCYSPAKFLEAMRVFSKITVDQNLLDAEHIECTSRIFEHAERHVLQVFLESGIVSHAKSQLGYNLLPHVYGNCNSGVIELLRDKGLDSEARGSTGKNDRTALHFAITFCIPRNVKILLNAGGYPNDVIKKGMSSLWYASLLKPSADGPLAHKIECLDLLLRHDADVASCGYNFAEYLVLGIEQNLALLDRVLAHLAMLDAMGSSNQSAMDYINLYEELRSRYETCQRQLNEMKERTVAGSFSLMKVLTSKPGEIARIVGAQDEKIITALTHEGSLTEFNGYYSKRLKDNLDRAFRLGKLRTKMAHHIFENITSFKGHDFVVDKIISYFNFEELLVLE